MLIRYDDHTQDGFNCFSQTPVAGFYPSDKQLMITDIN